MLNRPNEINIIESYTGAYCFSNNNISTRENNNPRSYIVKDESLRLKINFKKNQKLKNFQIAKLNSISALFYGELYNFDELIDSINWRDGDKSDLSFSHLCCLLYQKYGLDFAKYINGMFSLVLRDQEEDIFLLIVDRFGLAKPIYYSISKKLHFSMHLKLLLEKQEISHDIDKNSLALFLKYSYIPSPRTIVKVINKLNPGEMIVCKRDNLRIERYIDFEIRPKKISEEEAVYQYIKLLSESISSKLETYKGQKVGFFLSGGLDSSANVALAAKLNKCNFESFGIGFEDPSIDERPYAKIVANNFEIPFNEYVFDGSDIEDLPKMIWHLEEPFLENGLFLTYAGFKSAQSKADVVISGNCADQLFGTGGFAGGKPIALRYLLEKFHVQSLFNRTKRFTQTPLFYKDNALFKLKVLLDRGLSFNDWFFWGFDDHELAKLCRFDIPSKSLEIFSNSLVNIPLRLADYYQYSVIHQDLEHYTCQNILFKTHRMAEMFGVVARDPYLDYKVVDFILGLELPLKRKGSLIDYLLNNTKSKSLHRRAIEKVLPERILTKAKQGGSINMTLLLENLQRRKIIFAYLSKSNFLKEFMNMKYISKLLADYENIIKKRGYWQNYRDTRANQILNLLTVSLWSDIILNNKEKEPPTTGLNDMLY